MPDKPAAEVDIDDNLVRALLRQAENVIPDASARPLRLAAAGWDCEMWRLGTDLAVRLPRRAQAAPLIENEQRVLPGLSALIEPSGVRVPRPVFAGAPTDAYPWRWSVVPWFDGTSSLTQTPAERSAWAPDLASALTLLHAAAPADAPLNPFRGVPLADRDAAVVQRLDALNARGAAPERRLTGAYDLWRAGVEASAHPGPAVWVHGDLHPGNLVVDDDRLVAIIDFGDVTSGDPAYDLAVAWLAFDKQGRDAFIRALVGRYDASVWTRARAWAVAVAAMLMEHSDDNPDYLALGAEALAETVA